MITPLEHSIYLTLRTSEKATPKIAHIYVPEIEVVLSGLYEAFSIQLCHYGIGYISPTKHTEIIL